MFNPRFSYCIGNIRVAKVKGDVSLCIWFNRIRNPSDKMVEAIANVRSAKTPEIKNKLKEKLPSVTPAVRFKKGDNRKYDNILDFTGIAMLDFDKIDHAPEFRDYIFNTYPFIVGSWLSSSGRGCRAVIRIPICKSTDEFKLRYGAIDKVFKQYYGFDTAPKNCVLPLFYSIDAEIKFSLHRNQVFTDIASPSPIIPMKQIDWKRPDDKKTQWAMDNTRKAIEKINDNGHPQLVRAASALGGYVGAGYLGEAEAIGFVHALIESNQYLSIKPDVYKKTATEMIRRGIQNPLTL
jgi:hypothetical protein